MFIYVCHINFTKDIIHFSESVITCSISNAYKNLKFLAKSLIRLIYYTIFIRKSKHRKLSVGVGHVPCQLLGGSSSEVLLGNKTLPREAVKKEIPELKTPTLANDFSSS